MYKKFYALKNNPFHPEANPNTFFSSWLYGEALDNILYGIEEKKSLILVTGEIGTGKTILCRKVVKILNENTKIAIIENPDLNFIQLLKNIIKQFGVPQKLINNPFDLINILNDFLIKETQRGYNCALIIDEAQKLSTSQLKKIRLLTNLETKKQKLLQIVLVGHPYLHKKLKNPSLQQLNQRIMVRFHLTPLNQSDLKDYINFKILKCGKKSSPSVKINFTDSALDMIYEYSGGTPQMANTLCHRILLEGCHQKTYIISAKIVKKCVDDLKSTPFDFFKKTTQITVN